MQRAAPCSKAVALPARQAFSLPTNSPSSLNSRTLNYCQRLRQTRFTPQQPADSARAPRPTPRRLDTMLRRNARLRKEFLYRKSLEGKEKELYEKKRKIRQALEGAF